MSILDSLPFHIWRTNSIFAERGDVESHTRESNCTITFKKKIYMVAVNPLYMWLWRALNVLQNPILNATHSLYNMLFSTLQMLHIYYSWLNCYESLCIPNTNIQMDAMDTQSLVRTKRRNLSVLLVLFLFLRNASATLGYINLEKIVNGTKHKLWSTYTANKKQQQEPNAKSARIETKTT